MEKISNAHLYRRKMDIMCWNLLPGRVNFRILLRSFSADLTGSDQMMTVEKITTSDSYGNWRKGKNILILYGQ